MQKHAKFALIGNNPELYSLVQDKLIEKGFYWPSGSRETSVAKYEDQHCIIINFDYDNEIMFSSLNWLRNVKCIEVSIVDLLKEEAIKKPKKITVALNGDYNAEFTEGNDYVQVGCQKIPLKNIEKMMAEIAALKSK